MITLRLRDQMCDFGVGLGCPLQVRPTALDCTSVPVVTTAGAQFGPGLQPTVEILGISGDSYRGAVLCEQPVPPLQRIQLPDEHVSYAAVDVPG